MISFLGFILASIPTLFPAPNQQLQDQEINNLEKAIADEINKKRAEAKLPALKVIQELCYLSRMQADEFERLGLRGHLGKEWGYLEQRANAIFGWSAPLNVKPNNRSPGQDMMTDNSFDVDEEGHLDVGELHWIIDGWMNSKGHKDAIMMNTTSQTGVGISPKGTRIFQVFASLTAQRLKTLEEIDKIAPDLFKEDGKAIAAINKILGMNEGAGLVRLSYAARYSPHAPVRKKACEALAQLNKKLPKIKGIVPELIALVDDPAIGADAQKQLQSITGQSLGGNKSAWQNWWSSARPSFSAK